MPYRPHWAPEAGWQTNGLLQEFLPSWGVHSFQQKFALLFLPPEVTSMVLGPHMMPGCPGQVSSLTSGVLESSGVQMQVQIPAFSLVSRQVLASPHSLPSLVHFLPTTSFLQAGGASVEASAPPSRGRGVPSVPASGLGVVESPPSS